MSEKESSCRKFYLKNISNCELQPKCRSVKKFHEDAESLKHGLGELPQVRSNGYTDNIEVSILSACALIT